MVEFTQGQRGKLGSRSNLLTLVVKTEGSAPEYDLVCFGLDAAGQLSDDRYMVFFNQPQTPEGAVQMRSSPQSTVFQLALSRLPPWLERLSVAITVDEPHDLSSLRLGQVSLIEEGQELMRFAFQPLIVRERALMLCEVYRREVWRVTALGQGFNGGLKALLEHFGGVAEEGAPDPDPSPEQRPHRLQTFRETFLSACEDDVLTEAEWRDLEASLRGSGITLEQALEHIRPDALRFLERTLTLAAADGELSESEQAEYGRLKTLLRLEGPEVQPLDARIAELERISRIRRGQLPTRSSHLMLAPEELCHLEVRAGFVRVGGSRSKRLEGTLTLSNRQMYFSGDDGASWTVKYKSILRIQEGGNGAFLDTAGKAKGFYEADDPLTLCATLDALVRLDRRLLLQPQTERASRHIPHAVRVQVWQRDGGRCVECGKTEYLEFDHVIPHSRGGSSTLGNVQLLCRGCNLAKSDQI